MNPKSKSWTQLGFSLLAVLLFQQVSAGDGTDTLSAEQVLQIVKTFHPVAKQAAIGVEKSKAGILIARSEFDPVVSHKISQKTFGGENYYTYMNPHISIPTWFGVEVAAGVENLSGNKFVDPSETIGLTSYAGISVPLLKNLLIDKRRAYLQQAKVFKTISEVEQKLMINNLLMEAMDAYWDWVKNYQTYAVIKNTVEVNERRLDLIRKSFLNGERPAIDTAEALAQLQGFQLLMNESWLAFQNAGLSLSVFLWQQNDQPYLLPSHIQPPLGWERDAKLLDHSMDLQKLIELAESAHPEVELYKYKLELLSIDKKLKFQELLPKVDASYNLLGKGYQVMNAANTLFSNNYQYGLKMEVPLRFSAGRGAYQMAKLKIQETDLSRSQKRLQIVTKVKSYYNEYTTIKRQIELQGSNYLLYKKLVAAEEARLANGESALFVVNSRESKALEAYQKLIELKAKYFKVMYALQWSAGILQ